MKDHKDDDTTSDEITGSYKTLRQTFIDHPDLFDLVVVLGQLEQTISNDSSITLLSHAVQKGFTFTPNDLGYQLTITHPED